MVNDDDCKVTVKKGGPVLDVRWNKEIRLIGIGFNHASGRRFCAYDYDGCDQYSRRNFAGVLTLSLVRCHGPKSYAFSHRARKRHARNGAICNHRIPINAVSVPVPTLFGATKPVVIYGAFDLGIGSPTIRAVKQF
jgi:hypothetical protein